MNIQLYSNTNVTSRILRNAGGLDWVESLLLIDEPSPGNHRPCAVIPQSNCPSPRLGEVLKSVHPAYAIRTGWSTHGSLFSFALALAAFHRCPVNACASENAVKTQMLILFDF